MAYGYTRTETVVEGAVGGTLYSFTAWFHRIEDDFKVVGSGGHVQSADGYDLNLFDDDGFGAANDPLPSYTEQYNSATGEVGKLAFTGSITSSSLFHWQYGDSSISTSQDDPTNVYSVNTKAAYPFSDNAANTVVTDLTGNFTGETTDNTSTHSTTASIMGRGFDLAPGKIAQVTSALPLTSLNLFTLSTWITLHGNVDEVFGPYIGNAGADGAGFMVHDGSAGSGNLLTILFGGQTLSAVGSGWNFSADTPYRVSLTRDGVGTCRVFINGVQQAAVGATPNTPSGTTTWIAYGGNAGAGAKFDLPLFENTPRDAAWLLAEYNNQLSAETFFDFGAEIPLGVSIPIFVNHYRQQGIM